jgi:TP901 family phage tail tape measure protein
VRTVGVKLTADTTGYISGLARASAATKDFTGQIDKASKTGKLDKVADSALKLGVVGAAAFIGIVKSAADFDKQMSAVSAATHASTQDMALLRAAALQAGKDTQYSATQAADGITQLSKAGISTADILGGGLKGALSLAAAGQLAVGDAAEIAASALTQFKLQGKDVPHVADLLAAAAGKAQGSVQDMGMALNQSGLVAAQFGLSIEDTTGVLAEFANAGLTGSDAGTSLKTMLLALANPTGQTRDLMHQLGISFYDAAGKFIGFNGVAQVLQTRLKGLTDAQRQQALGQIFGNDAIRSASILYTDGAAGVDKWKGAVNDAGYASATAAKLTDNLAGDVERLKGSVETLAISSGSGANGGLRVLTQALNSVVNGFLGLPPAVGSTVTVLAGVGGAAALALAAFIKLRKGMAEAVIQLEAMGPAGVKAAAGLSAAASVAGKLSVALVALEALGMVADHFKATAASADDLTAALQTLADTGQATGALADTFGKNLSGMGKELNLARSATEGVTSGFNKLLENIPGVGSAVDALNEKIYGTSYGKVTQDTQALDQALVQYMTTTGDAVKSSALWNQVLSKSGMNTEDLAKLLPNAYKQLGQMNNAAMKSAAGLNASGTAALGTSKKMGDVTSALDVGAAAQDKYATVADAAAGAARGEAAALTALSAKLKAQTDPVFALLDAEQGLKTAQDAASAAVKKHGRNSDEAREATRKLTLAAIALQGAAGTAAQTMDGKLSPALVTTLRKAGLTEAQIADVTQQFKDAKTAADKYTGSYVAKVSITGDAAVGHKLELLSQAQDALKNGKPIPGPARKYFGDGPGFSSGGYTGDGDKYEPAGIVHRGEMVLNQQATSNLEATRPGALLQMNETGTWPGYFKGGIVGWPYPTTAAMTQIPKLAAAGPAAPGGAPGYKWMEMVARAAFPGIGIISDYRPGAVTLTGNRSYHAVGRAVDFSPSKPFAEWVNANYFARTKELITPWQSLNIHNGARHHYSPLIENQHSGSNAHDHWAMANGGVIPEPVFGYGRSGRTYSFAENGPERVLPAYASASGAGHAGGGTTMVTFAPVIHINGQHISPQQIASRVNRELGALIDQYARGN